MILSVLIGILFISSIALIFRNKIGRNGVCLLIISFNIIAFVSLLIAFFLVNTITFELSEIILWSYSTSCVTFNWGFYVDRLSFIFMLTILIISTIIMIYSISYMYIDNRFAHFISFLGYFVFFMLVLILSNNFVQMFIGWEGVGLVSFLLVNFWYARIDSNKGALKALIFNRVGDVGFVLFISIMFYIHGTVNVVVYNILLNPSTIIIGLIVLAAAGKSAQLLLYAWLPDAMEGPTPVSALLHSATMVTAGIFLLLRCSSYIHNSNTLIILVLLTIGLFTSISSGIFAIFKYDIKKIIAFSTCSQLGLLVCGVAFGLITATFYHLFIHAFFKALLFLASGLIIHSIFDEQDIRKYGNVSSFMNLFVIVTGIGTLNIIGFPYISGFYSKENLILYPFISNAILIKSSILISSIVTVIYSIRLISRCVSYEPYVHRNILINMQKSDNYITIVLTVLAFIAVFIGYVFSDTIVGISNNTFVNFLQYYYINLNSEIIIYSLFYIILGLTFNFIIFYYYILTSISSSGTYIYIYLASCYQYFIQECFLPMLLWSISYVYNIIAYNFVLKCVEKGVLEIVGLIQVLNILNKLNNKTFDKQIIQMFYYLQNILVGIFIIFYLQVFLSILSINVIQLLLILLLLFYLNKKNNKK